MRRRIVARRMGTSETNGRPPSALKQRRKDLKLRQRDVADQAGCAISLISMAESGYVPRPELQHSIAAAVSASAGSFW